MEYILSIGSNINNPEKQISLCHYHITKQGITILKESSWVSSKAMGYSSDNLFINQSILISTDIQPLELLHLVKGIEHKMGRKKSKKGYEDRCIDIDIVWSEKPFQSKDLCIPHKEWTNRLFVLIPSVELINENELSLSDSKLKLKESQKIMQFL